WPLGHLLAEFFGWRGALLAYAGFALLTVPLHLAIPEGRYREVPAQEDRPRPPVLIAGKRNLAIAGGLYALIMTLANFLNAGMSAHMIGILAGLGLAASTSVWIATLRGIGQSSARLCEVLFGRRLDPLMLNLIACLFLPLAFTAGLFSGYLAPAAIAFAVLCGAGNGLLRVTRGTLPLVLFAHRTYGAFVGRLIAPSFVLSAASPIVYAFVISRLGQAGALYLSIGVAAVTLAAAALLLALSAAWRKAGE